MQYVGYVCAQAPVYYNVGTTISTWNQITPTESHMFVVCYKKKTSFKGFLYY